VADGALAIGGWSAACRVVARGDLAELLVRRRREAPPVRSVGVTDLLDPRSAYWRTVSPIEPTPDRRAILERGREAHVRVGHALAPARFREVRLRREGIIGQVDLVEEGPVEIKTTSLPRDADALRAGRPSYIEQLAMYCALLDHPAGRLLLVGASEGAPTAVDVYDGRFGDLGVVWAEMTGRAAELRQALERRSPSGLPRCPWRGRGCEFETSKACDCTGDEPVLRTSIRDQLVDLSRNADASAAVERRLAASEHAAPPIVRRFRDLIYPRRAYYERTEPGTPPPPGAPGFGRPPGPEDLYRTLSDLLESGPPGEMTREPTPSGEPLESVPCFRGDPLLLKVTRSWNAPPADRLLREQPQYFVDLALRCATLGRPRGWLVVGYERAPDWGDKVRVFEVTWEPIAVASELLAARRTILLDAVAAGEPARLPACPGWMVGGCAYIARCGCGAPPAASRENR
jgi:hypothetical protein